MANWFVQTSRIFACFSIQTIRTLNFIFVLALQITYHNKINTDDHLYYISTCTFNTYKVFKTIKSCALKFEDFAILLLGNL